MHEPERTSLLGIIGGLMIADHLGDVSDEIDFLCDRVGIPRSAGDFSEGWTEQDFANVGLEGGEDG